MAISNSKLLIVDDDLISLQVLSNYLQTTNYPFVTATDGQQAWELLQQSPAEFSVVIADRIMPKLHGIELLNKMREQENLKHIPFIMLTGEADKDEMITAMRAGVFDFLYKPVEKTLLLAVLNRALSK